MKTTLVTPPAAEPVLIADLKAHLNIDSSFTDDDTYIESLEKVARRYAESVCRRKFITQTWNLLLEEWPTENYITFPYGQLISIVHIKYTDSNEDQSTFSTDDYSIDTDSEPGRGVLDYGKTWPGSTLWPLNAIESQFTLGYGVAGSDVPDEILFAIKLMVADMYENREMSVRAVSINKLDTFDNLLSSYRLWY